VYSGCKSDWNRKGAKFAKELQRRRRQTDFLLRQLRQSSLKRGSDCCPDCSNFVAAAAAALMFF
jgi:hypothetical protein